MPGGDVGCDVCMFFSQLHGWSAHESAWMKVKLLEVVSFLYPYTAKMLKWHYSNQKLALWYSDV